MRRRKRDGGGMAQMLTQLPDARRTPRFAGVSTFCRFPRLEDAGDSCRPFDWLIYGAAYDGGVTYRPGARFGPRAVRDESQYVKPYSVHHGVNICEAMSMADAGDAPVRPYSPKENAEAIAAFAIGLPDPGVTKLMAVGGDHSIAYANIRATWERMGKPAGGLAVAHFDSHLDTVDAVWGEKWGHASPFIRAIEDGLIDPRRMISVGIKGPLNTATDLDFAAQRGVTIVTREMLDASAGGAGSKAIADFKARVGRAPCYVTFDIDVVDPAFAPGTGTPSVGGISSAEALTLVRSLAGLQVAGADVVEVLPDRDHAGITALLAAHIVFEILCVSAVSRR